MGQSAPSGGNGHRGRPSTPRHASASATKRARPLAIARRTPGTLTSVGTPARSYAMPTAQPGPSADSLVSTAGAGKPRAAIAACTSICAANERASAVPGQTFTKILKRSARVTVTAAPTLSSMAVTRARPKPCPATQSRIIPRAVPRSSVPNTLRASSRSSGSVQPSIIIAQPSGLPVRRSGLRRKAPSGCHSVQASATAASRSAFQAHGSSRSSSCALVRPETIRSSTSVSHARGSTPLSFAVATRLATIAQ